VPVGKLTGVALMSKNECAIRAWGNINLLRPGAGIQIA